MELLVFLAFGAATYLAGFAVVAGFGALLQRGARRGSGVVPKQLPARRTAFLGGSRHHLADAPSEGASLARLGDSSTGLADGRAHETEPPNVTDPPTELAQVATGLPPRRRSPNDSPARPRPVSRGESHFGDLVLAAMDDLRSRDVPVSAHYSIGGGVDRQDVRIDLRLDDLMIQVTGGSSSLEVRDSGGTRRLSISGILVTSELVTKAVLQVTLLRLADLSGESLSSGAMIRLNPRLAPLPEVLADIRARPSTPAVAEKRQSSESPPLESLSRRDSRSSTGARAPRESTHFHTVPHQIRRLLNDARGFRRATWSELAQVEMNPGLPRLRDEEWSWAAADRAAGLFRSAVAWSGDEAAWLECEAHVIKEVSQSKLARLGAAESARAEKAVVNAALGLFSDAIWQVMPAGELRLLHLILPWAIVSESDWIQELHGAIWDDWVIATQLEPVVESWNLDVDEQDLPEVVDLRSHGRLTSVETAESRPGSVDAAHNIGLRELCPVFFTDSSATDPERPAASPPGLTALQSTRLVRGTDGTPISSEEERSWLAARRKGITATDAKRLLRLNGQRRTSWQLVLKEKLTGYSASFEPMQHGLIREPVIASWVNDVYGITPNRFLFHGINPRHLATPDGIGPSGLAEIKTSVDPLKLVIRRCRDQMQWQMHVMECDRVLLVVENRYTFTREVSWVKRDQVRIDALVIEADFLLEELDRESARG